MSVFKRLGNVARGKIKELGRSLEEGLDGLEHRSEGDASTEPVREPRGEVSDEQKRQMLDRLLEEGLLTEDEHRRKRAALERPGPDTPRKRRL